eukprot:644104_1
MSSLLLLATISTLLQQVRSKISDHLIAPQDRTSPILWNQDTLSLTYDMGIIHHNSNLNHNSVFPHGIHNTSFESLLSPHTTYMSYNDTGTTHHFRYHTQSTYDDAIHHIVFHILNETGFDVTTSPAKDHSTSHSLSNDTQTWHGVSACYHDPPASCHAHVQIRHLNAKDQVVLGDLSRLHSKPIHVAHAYPFDKEITMGSDHLNKDHDEDYHQCIATITDDVDSLRSISLIRRELDWPHTLDERVPHEVMWAIKAPEKKKPLKQATSATHPKDANADAHRIYTDTIANTLHSTLKINPTNPTISADDACNSWLSISSSSVDLSKRKYNNMYTYLIWLWSFMFCMAMNQVVSTKHIAKFIIICVGMHFGACLSLDIVLGGHHTCVLSTSNRVKCFGYNLYGQLGLGDTNN